MKRLIIIATAILLLSGCRKEEKDLLLGIWELAGYTARNARTGELIPVDTSVETWEFTRRDYAYVNGDHGRPYKRTEKGIQMDGTEYEIVALHSQSLQVRWEVPAMFHNDGSLHTYTFRRSR